MEGGCHKVCIKWNKYFLGNLYVSSFFDTDSPPLGAAD